MPDLSSRLREILSEQNLQQKDLAQILGVSPNYINILVNGRRNKISETLANLIEEKCGYSAKWLLDGIGKKSVEEGLNKQRLETIKKIKKMDNDEINAVLAFVNSLDEVKKIFNTPPKK